MEKINKQRKEYLNWDQYFMGVAKLSALRSKDPSTQVGACISQEMVFIRLEQVHILKLAWSMLRCLVRSSRALL